MFFPHLLTCAPLGDAGNSKHKKLICRTSTVCTSRMSEELGYWNHGELRSCLHQGNRIAATLCVDMFLLQNFCTLGNICLSRYARTECASTEVVYPWEETPTAISDPIQKFVRRALDTSSIRIKLQTSCLRLVGWSVGRLGGCLAP